jgi:hypothetical protein
VVETGPVSKHLQSPPDPLGTHRPSLLVVVGTQESTAGSPGVVARAQEHSMHLDARSLRRRFEDAVALSQRRRPLDRGGGGGRPTLATCAQCLKTEHPDQASAMAGWHPVVAGPGRHHK